MIIICATVVCRTLHSQSCEIGLMDREVPTMPVSSSPSSNKRPRSLQLRLSAHAKRVPLREAVLNSTQATLSSLSILAPRRLSYRCRNLKGI